MVKIQKEEKEIIAYTSNFRIRGTIFMPPGARLSDYISGAGQKKFIPVTNALVSDHSERKICNAMFIELNKDEIIFLLPAPELEKK